MLLGAMNYNNNLGFALTFLLAGVGIVSMHHCHHNLAPACDCRRWARSRYSRAKLCAFAFSWRMTAPSHAGSYAWDGTDTIR